MILSANWRPTEQLRVEGTYNWQWYDRGTDGSRVAQGRIPRVKLEYQLSPGTVVFAGYGSAMRDARA